MTKKIKRMRLDKDWRIVTIQFSKRPTPENSFSCFLRVEIYMAIALFKTGVNWVTETFQVARSQMRIEPQLGQETHVRCESQE